MSVEHLSEKERDACRRLVNAADWDNPRFVEASTFSSPTVQVPLTRKANRQEVEVEPGVMDALAYAGLIRTEPTSSGGRRHTLLPSARRAVERDFVSEPVVASSIVNQFYGDVHGPVAAGQTVNQSNTSAAASTSDELAVAIGRLCESVLDLLQDVPEITELREERDRLLQSVQDGADRPTLFRRAGSFVKAVAGQVQFAGKTVDGGKKIAQAIEYAGGVVAAVDTANIP